MKRAVLDQLARDNGFSEEAAAAALDLAGARPSDDQWCAFAAKLMHGAGVAAIGAGVIFFVAANWQDYGVLGRFVLLQVAFAACAALAWLRPPPLAIGNSALVMAILFIGGLLALFGQSYQTGADLFELFFAWAALALPFTFAARTGVVWAVWWIVANIGLALYCGWMGPEDFVWRWLEQRGIEKPLVVLVPAAVNLGGAALFREMNKAGDAQEAPRWLIRMLLAIGFAYGTSATILALLGHGLVHSLDPTMQGLIVAAAFAIASAVIGVATVRGRRDVFPMALILAAWIVISTGCIIKSLRMEDIGGFFLISLWLIGTSTGAGFILMHWVRAWRVEEDRIEVTA